MNTNSWNRGGAQFAALSVAIAVAGHALAAPIAYPYKNQSPAQQQKDDGECHIWARNKTGVDPAVIASTPPPPSGPAVGGGERAKGAVGGAVVGGLIGGDSHGAATGAAVGILAGGMKARQKQQAQQQQAKAQTDAALDTFHRAYGACMEGRGYTIR